MGRPPMISVYPDIGWKITGGREGLESILVRTQECVVTSPEEETWSVGFCRKNFLYGVLAGVTAVAASNFVLT